MHFLMKKYTKISKYMHIRGLCCYLFACWGDKNGPKLEVPAMCVKQFEKWLCTE